MGYTEFKNLPSKDTPLSAEKLNEMQKGLMELVFPIGSTYVTQSDTNPKDILKFGTWERFKGLISLGVDENDSNLNAIGKKGGEKEHILAIDEMPEHKHSNGNIYALTPNIGSAKGVGAMGGTGTVSQYLGDDGNTGGNKPHNNLPPYEVTGYIWIRRA